MIDDFQYLFVASSAYLGILEARLRGEKIPDDTFKKAQGLFQAAYVRAGLRFKNIPEPHYTREEVEKLLEKLGEEENVPI